MIRPRVEVLGRSRVSIQERTQRIPKTNNGREHQEFDELRMDTVLSPGQTLIVTCAPEARGLGGFFFAEAVGAGDRSLMLLRLAQSQYDDLFQDNRAASPLVTPIE